jgi:hypothetical protein
VSEAEIACCGFVVACCEAAGAFEFVEAALDAVSKGISYCIDEDWYFAVCFAHDDWGAATAYDDVSDVIAVITPICQDDFGTG